MVIHTIVHRHIHVNYVAKLKSLHIVFKVKIYSDNLNLRDTSI